ncbi:CHAT domain-containing protein, partial [Alisedimentitalea sp. MJ-SS2]|uniref:CHAT domain-containing protein n=1 Tax=Aliisedimentitalea sp. MJ-SS2 TaxID=3049795 RepID=UPI002908A184
GHFAEFHANWLQFCLDNGDHEVIPEVLLALQGREVATAVLDGLALDEGEIASEALAAYQTARRELREMSERMQSGTPAAQAQMAAYRDRQAELQVLRDAARQEPGFELLSLPQSRVDAEALQGSLAEDEALLVLMTQHNKQDMAVNAHAVLMKRDSVEHVPCYGLLKSAEVMQGFCRDVAAGHAGGRGYRRGGFESPQSEMVQASYEDFAEEAQEAAEVDSGPGLLKRLAGLFGRKEQGEVATGPEVVSEPRKLDAFWPALEAHQNKDLWSRLAPHLKGVRRVIGITHGALHLVGLTAGAPEDLEIVQYPGLVFFALKRGLYGGGAEAEPLATMPGAAPRHIGVLSHDDGNIPLAAAEGDAVSAMWQAADQAEVAFPASWPEGTALDYLHVASHGATPDTGPVILLGPGKTIDEATVSEGPVADVVFLNICLGGHSADRPLDGSPSGLVSGFLRRGSQVVIAALPPVPDLWAYVLSLIVTDELIAGEPRVEVALARAKARLANGDWPEGTEARLRDGFEARVLPQIRNHVKDSMTFMENDLGHCMTSLRRISPWWLEEATLDELEDVLATTPVDQRMATAGDILTRNATR